MPLTNWCCLLATSNRFRVEGMTCSSCSAAVESAVAGLPGVRHAAVSLLQAEARVEYDEGVTDEVRSYVFMCGA